jgi:hypothetical protein
MTRTTQLATTIAARAAAAHQTIAEYLADEAMRISAIRLGRATEAALALPREQTRAWLAGEEVRTTAGKNGVPALVAIKDETDVDDEPDELDSLDYYPAELPSAQTVDGEMTGLHRALVTAMAGATTWRT